MDCYYINLANQQQRRIDVERSFSRHMPSARWHLHRFEACTTKDAEHLAGSTDPNEKACLLSHWRLLEQLEQRPDPILILEDDAVFCPDTPVVIDGVLAKQRSWDILFTDLSILSQHTMINMLSHRQAMFAGRTNGRIENLDQKFGSFAGSTAYLISANGRKKLLAYLRQQQSFDLPYDIILRSTIEASLLQGRVLIPFVTSLSRHALTSTISHGQHGLQVSLWTLFRQFIWVDRQEKECNSRMAKLQAAHATPTSQTVSKCLAYLLSKSLPTTHQAPPRVFVSAQAHTLPPQSVVTEEAGKRKVTGTIPIRSPLLPKEQTAQQHGAENQSAIQSANQSALEASSLPISTSPLRGKIPIVSRRRRLHVPTGSAPMPMPMPTPTSTSTQILSTVTRVLPTPNKKPEAAVTARVEIHPRKQQHTDQDAERKAKNTEGRNQPAILKSRPKISGSLL